MSLTTDQADTVRASVRKPAVHSHARELRADGWACIRQFLSDDDLAPLRADITSLVETEAPDIDPWGPQSGRLNTAARANIDRCLGYLPGLMRLAAQETLLQRVRELGIKQPAIMQSHEVRMEGPGEDGRLHPWHQDFTYLLGSPNAVTLWIPLTPADAIRGSVQIIPATHREGVHPVEPISSRHTRHDASLSPRDLVMVDPPAENSGIIVEATPGDVIAFSGLTIHRSTPNLTDRIRWTAELRHADLASPGFRDAGYPFGDRINIFHADYRGTFYDPRP